jgi:hypothetical protein
MRAGYERRTVRVLLIHVSDLSAKKRDLAGMITRRHLVIGLAVLLAPPPLLAQRERDQDRARRAVERGEALPLSDILARVRPNLAGEVVGVSFERKKERWVYEFKVIRPGGALVELYVDARSAEIIKQEEH